MSYEGLRKAMKDKGDTQQDLAHLLGFKWHVSVGERFSGKRKWKKLEIEYCCQRYGKTKEELGF